MFSLLGLRSAIESAQNDQTSMIQTILEEKEVGVDNFPSLTGLR